MTESSSIYSTDSETRMLREAARRFLAGNWPAERAVPGPGKPEELRRLWREIARQGWLALGAEAGTGSMRMASILLEELGRAACPAPLLDAFLGEVILSCVLGPYDGDANAGAFDVAGGGEDARIHGRAAFVEGTSIATHFLV